MLAYILTAFGGLLSLAWLVWIIRKAGKDSVVRDYQDEVLDDIYKAKVARDKLRARQSYAKRLRKKYTRK